LLKNHFVLSGRSACPAAARAAQEREREKQVAMIKAQYLGAEKQKKKVLKPSEKFRFNFDWEARAARAARARPCAHSTKKHQLPTLRAPVPAAAGCKFARACLVARNAVQCKGVCLFALRVSSAHACLATRRRATIPAAT